MKKVALSLAVLFAAALVSCGNKQEATEEAPIDSTATEVVDSVAAPVDSVAPATEAPATETPATEAPAEKTDSVAK